MTDDQWERHTGPTFPGPHIAFPFHTFDGQKVNERKRTTDINSMKPFLPSVVLTLPASHSYQKKCRNGRKATTEINVRMVRS